MGHETSVTAVPATMGTNVFPVAKKAREYMAWADHRDMEMENTAK
jgi:hypothetical protein